MSQYLPRDIYDQLLASYECALFSLTPWDRSLTVLLLSPSFTALDAHRKMIQDEAMSLAAGKMNAVEARESQDNSKEEKDGGDKKRKAKTSVGVEKLKKANIKGMAKLSSFFQKK